MKHVRKVKRVKSSEFRSPEEWDSNRRPRGSESEVITTGPLHRRFGVGLGGLEGAWQGSELARRFGVARIGAGSTELVDRSSVCNS